MIVLSNARKLYDGKSAEPHSVHTAVDLTIEGERIRSVAPHDPTLVPGDGRAVIDCSDYTITPGLVDCHGHITALGLTGEAIDRSNDPGRWSTSKRCSTAHSSTAA